MVSRGFLPSEVFQEILKMLRTEITETPFVKRDRLKREYEHLVQGNRPHHEFKAMFKEILLDMKNAGMGIVHDHKQLYDDYKHKC